MATCKILLADDGSEHARAAASLVGDLPLPAGCSVTVLRIFASTQAGELTLLEELLNRTCAFLKDKGLQAQPELLLGSPAEKIVEYAEEHHPDLIVIGAKGLRASLGIFLGGVAQQVVEYGPCPVLVVRAPYVRLRRVLLAVDGSSHSQEAVRYLGKFPLPNGVRLWVMTVLPPPPFPIVVPELPFGGYAITSPQPVTEEMTIQRAQEEKEGQALLVRTVKELRTFGLPAESVLKRGDAATEMIEFIKEEEIDLVVTGSRGLSRVKSWLMGSLSRKLVHYSGCSVLVVRGTQ